MNAPLPPNVILRVESREQLLGWLSEAAEIEHNLMCCYLYAMFSLKRSPEGLSEAEFEAVQRWRGVLRTVAMEEMTHLTLVANLMLSVGGTPHFQRPNFPVAPGLFPASLVIELAPFNLDTLDHFVFVERPENAQVDDGGGFVPARVYQRGTPSGRLMTYGSDYLTVGDLYRAIELSLDELAHRHGEANLFCGAGAQQVGPLDTQLPGLTLVRDLASARSALDVIVTQGEGSVGHADSHYERFLAVRREYAALLAANPDFAPAHPAARNPVMRRPPQPEGRVWITEPLAGRYVDAANAAYVLMLRVLVQTWAVAGRSTASKRALLRAGHWLMRAVSPLAERLTELPANADLPGVNGGISFATLRSVPPLNAGCERAVLCERIDEIRAVVVDLEAGHRDCGSALAALDSARAELLSLSSPGASTATLAVAASDMPPAAAPEPSPAPQPESLGEGVERIPGQRLSLVFEARRCIHARHCVTETPGVFKANTPGAWIFPDAASAERLAAVVQRCPSGALRYERHDGGEPELLPEVNLVHVRESGPLAFRGELLLHGEVAGTRATLCRCGQSKNKPWCDGSHNDAGFVASGEPATLDATMLPVRNGPLALRPQRNGPLEVSGNLELCSGTGRVVLRSADPLRLCRCGQSRNKPFCDSSHVAAGFVAD